jgi:acyl carrier protein
MTETERWLIDYLQAHGPAAGDDPETLLDDNYFERELLDSLGIVQMIVGIEDSFGVTLETEHMQDPRFCTVRGLGAIIAEVRAPA